MEKSESIVNIAKALLEFHKEVGVIKKSEDNPFFKSKYADLPAVLEAIKEPLQKAGLIFLQFPTGINGLTTILVHAESGEFMKSTIEMEAVKEYKKIEKRDESGRVVTETKYGKEVPVMVVDTNVAPFVTPQGQGSAITYARRYALGAILGLSTEKDDDGNAASTPMKKELRGPVHEKSDPLQDSIDL